MLLLFLLIASPGFKCVDLGLAHIRSVRSPLQLLNRCGLLRRHVGGQLSCSGKHDFGHGNQCRPNPNQLVPASARISQISLSYSGDATNGVQVETLPDKVTIQQGQSQVLVPVVGRPGGAFIGTRTLIVTATNSSVPFCVSIRQLPDSSTTINVLGMDNPPPRLTAQGAGSGGIQLSWSTPVTGFVLQSSTNLLNSAWMSVTNSPVSIEGAQVVVLSRDEPTRFFRLLKP